jgi:hypothetical protein
MVYECEALKRGEGTCSECIHFTWGADSCIEDSILTPVYRTYWDPNYKPPEFERRKDADKPLAVIIVKK